MSKINNNTVSILMHIQKANEMCGPENPDLWLVKSSLELAENVINRIIKYNGGKADSHHAFNKGGKNEND